MTAQHDEHSPVLPSTTRTHCGGGVIAIWRLSMAVASASERPSPQRSFTLKLSPPFRSAARQRRRRVLSLTRVTKNLNIGCGFNIVPMWHPLRLAEDYAMADILTGGRVIFGVTTRAKSRPSNREMFEEGVEVLFKAFEGKPFLHRGKYYTIPPEVPYRGDTLKEITLVPALQRLPVECWQPIQSGSERAFDFMAKYVVDNHRLAGPRSPRGRDRAAMHWQACYTERCGRCRMNGDGA
jgi:hypothetical protein